jgi:hypothetical protein
MPRKSWCDDENIYLLIHVRPKSREEKLTEDEECYVFYTKEPPLRGKANRALVRYLSKKLGINSSRIRIVRGAKDRVKVIGISCEKREIDTILGRLSAIT